MAGLSAISLSCILALSGCDRKADTRVTAEEAPGAWSIHGAEFTGIYADVSEKTENARSIDFSADGTRMFVVGRFSQNVAAYRLREPWNLEGASYEHEFPLGDIRSAHGLFFNRDSGQDMYVFNRTELLHFKLSVPWDVTTAYHLATRKLACENAEVVRGHDIHFKPDGTRFYVEDRTNQEVYEYTLPSPWDTERLLWRSTLDISNEQKAARGIELDPSGTRMWILDTGRGEVLEYVLQHPWELESARFHSTLDFSEVIQNGRGITWRPDGKAFYITATDQGKIFELRIR